MTSLLRRERAPVMAGLLLAFGAGCAAPQPAVQQPRPEPPPASQPARAEPPPPPPASIPPISVEPTPLPWVNPARCLSPCTYDPAEKLVKVDGNGALDPQGPHRVAQEIVPHLRALLAAATAAGHPIAINSAFRSFDEQAHLFRTIKQPGRAARPGQSEHQVGTAVDLKLPSTEAAEWLSQHAADHGFVRSYPLGKQKITGYRPEPWHVRFVGSALAAEVRASGGTLEELFRQRPSLGVSGTCEDCPERASRKPCGRITAAGACTKGVLLSWCYEGALATVDCSAFGQKCQATGDGQHDCR